LEILKERDHLEELDLDGRIILKISLIIGVGRVLTGVMWLRRNTICGIFLTS
jgi:hypothetical protein